MKIINILIALSFIVWIIFLFINDELNTLAKIILGLCIGLAAGKAVAELLIK